MEHHCGQKSVCNSLILKLKFACHIMGAEIFVEPLNFEDFIFL